MDSNKENWTVARDFVKIFFPVYVEQNKRKKTHLAHKSQNITVS